MKKCTKCLELRDDFSSAGKNSRSQDGLMSWCKRCDAARAAKRRLEPGRKVAQALKDKERYWSNQPKAVSRARQWVLENPEKARASYLKRRYGSTAEEIDSMLVGQLGACAICGIVPDPQADFKGDRVLHIDHDHATGKVRGLLCRKHNTAIGLFQDDPVLLYRAGDYLSVDAKGRGTP